MPHRSTRWMAALMSLAALASMASAPANARRGGSFGSRGSRTYSAPRPTYSSGYVPPVERSMTTRAAYQQSPNYAPGYAQQPTYQPARSRFGGFGGGLLAGVVAGGLIGHFFGHGAGYGWGGDGGGGFLASLIQLAILGAIAWFVIGVFRRRSGGQSGGFMSQPGYAPQGGTGPWGGAAPQMAPAVDQGIDISITPADQRRFEELLIEVQDAFGREDYARLRTLTTPEIMSFLSEELSQNATRGVRNEVSGTRLIDAEVSEASREPGGDYATIVLRYESIDVMRDRASGAIASGAAHVPTETVEVWTFIRSAGSDWKLSAIQES